MKGTVNLEKMEQDINQLHKKKKLLAQDYPRTYREIAERFGVSIQYVFEISKRIKDIVSKKLKE